MSDVRGGWTSASNAEPDLLCPGRHISQRGLSESENEDQAFGRETHAALAKRDPQGLDAQQLKVYEASAEIENRIASQFFSGTPPDKLRSFPEQRLWATVELEGFKVHHSGQPDRVYAMNGRGLVIDYKNLYGEVPESPRNLQLRDYVVLAARHYFLKEVGCVVIQPLVTKDPELCIYGENDIQEAEAQMFSRIWASNDSRSARVPGARQCKFCLAAVNGTCLEYQRWNGSMMPALMSIMDVPVSGWTPETRALFCERFDIAQKWLNDTWAAMETGMKTDANFIPGWMMKKGYIKEEITDAQTVFERFLKLGTPEEQVTLQQVFMKCIKVGKSRLQDQVILLVGSSGRLLENKMKELLADCVSRAETKATLVRVPRAKGQK